MKAIIIEGVLKFKDSFKEFNGTVGLEYATDQQWYDWGFREYVVPVYTNLQYLGEVFYDSASDTYTFPVIDKTQEEIDAEFANRKTSLIGKFERDTDNLIKEIVGERAFEYELAETEAIAFKSAGYPKNDVPASVSSDAIANNYSNTIACDLILTMATNWRGVQTVLRANRLLAKANTKNALTIEELNTVEATWNTFLDNIRQQITT
jgi:hypothetical protein